MEDNRQGEGICQFANGNFFRGEWQEGCWLQSEAEPSLCRVSGTGLAHAKAGTDTVLSILVRVLNL